MPVVRECAAGHGAVPVGQREGASQLRVGLVHVLASDVDGRLSVAVREASRNVLPLILTVVAERHDTRSWNLRVTERRAKSEGGVSMQLQRDAQITVDAC